MLKELLGDLYTEEIAAKMGDKQLAVVNDGSWIPKSKFNEASSKAKDLEKQIQERDTQLEALKTAAAGNAELLKQLDDLKAANTAAQAEWEARIQAQAKNHAIEQAIAKAKGKNLKAVMANLDLAKVSLDGENLLGLDDQLAALQKSDPYLFGDGTPQVGGGTNPPGGAGVGTLQEQYDAVKADLRKTPGDSILMGKLFELKEKIRLGG